MNHQQVNEQLKHDVAYIWSLDNYSPSNLALVFRAYGFDRDLKTLFDHLDLYSK